ncbi:hypothetical protein [Nostocoides vanveenii]
MTWWQGATEIAADYAVAALRAHIPGLRNDRRNRIDFHRELLHEAAATLRLTGHRQTPLAVDDITKVEASVRGLLAALASARGDASLVLQVVLGPRSAPSRVVRSQRVAPGLVGVLTGRRDPVMADPTAFRGLVRKHADHRFGCEVRLYASASTAAAAHRLVEDLAANLRTLEAPGVRLHLRRLKPQSVTTARMPWRWPLTLSIPEVAAVSGWPVARDADAHLPGLPDRHPRLLPALPLHPRDSRLLGVATADEGPACDGAHRLLAIRPRDALRHLHVLGPTGVGKSTLLANLALSDMAAGHGLVVIDPKGDLVADLLSRVPEHRRADVVVLDATDPAPVGINALVPSVAQDGSAGTWNPDLAADTVLGVFHQLYADSWGPRTHDILASSLLTLARVAASREQGTDPMTSPSLVAIPQLLTNPGFRHSVVRQVAAEDPLGLGAFWRWYEALSDAERSQAIAPLMNKLRPILLRPGLRAIFGQSQPQFDIRDVFTKQRILLVNLAKGSIGPEASRLLGSLIVALFWQATLQRIGTPAGQRRPVFVHIDEMQDYLSLPGDLADALAQARGLGVGFTLAHQYLGQLPPGLRKAILANARSRIAFQLSDSDARDLAGRTGGQLQPADFTSLPAFQAYAGLLVDGSPAPWVSLTTKPLPPAHTDPTALIRTSRQRYGQPREQVDAELLAAVGLDAERSTAPPTVGESSDAVWGRSRQPGRGDTSGGRS